MRRIPSGVLREAGRVPDSFDLAIIGGGINGCGIARDASGRGLSVFLCEQGDLGGATSASSTKLIHGGLRYLEYYEFRLVREALIEREVLLRNAPHIIWPLRFVLPHHAGLRPAWLIRLGLFLYDHLGGREILPGTRSIDLTRDPVGRPLKPAFRRAFEYSDCWVEDSRLVVLNAMDAAERGAVIRPRTRCVRARRAGGGWTVELEDTASGKRSEIKARALVNAAGPWVAEVIGQCIGLNGSARVRLVKGSHIIVPRLVEHDRAYIFQNADGRIVFAIPYEGDFTLIGTTDVDYVGDPAQVRISEEETAYLCRAANEYFVRQIGPADVVRSYSGVRPLFDDGKKDAKAATRDYVLELDAPDGGAPVLNIFGGKITTFRRLAEAALDKLAPHLGPLAPRWTATAALPGGDLAVDGIPALANELRASCPALKPAQASRLARAYGTRARQIVDGAHSEADLGVHFGADLQAREVTYLMRHEWAQSAEDILWRRSKLGLRVSADDARRLADFMRERAPSLRAPAA
jgi:glycerol-3-phosphate dehydrogenase